MSPSRVEPATTLAALVQDAAARTGSVVDDLSDEEWAVPPLDIVNPMRWEVGHVSFFYDAMVLGELGEPLVLPEGAALYDSFDVAHAERWGLALPSRAATLDYRRRVSDALLERLERSERSERETYLYRLGVLHEDMHGEALTYTRQTLGYRPPPTIALATEITSPELAAIEDDPSGDADIPGGRFQLGASPGEAFVFDNEKWGHALEVAPFRIARTAVDNASFAAFVDDGGYRDARLWSRQGWRWRQRLGRRHPRYWHPSADGWLERRFDVLVPLALRHPVSHVCWYEADAYCRWAGRRLPTELEWEVAALGEPSPNGGLAPHKRAFPWGDAPPSPARANLDAVRTGPVDVRAHAAGDSAFGVRQLLGNVWEWTSDAFYPFPGYVVDTPYREYSAPWFGDRRVLRGGAWATRARLARPGYRNFFTPDRDDVLAGFRTVARDAHG